MSGECYVTGDSQKESKSCRERNTPHKGMKGDTKEKNINLDQLLEYEDLVYTAENKCSVLKGQLDTIKRLYANQADLIKRHHYPEQPTKVLAKAKPVKEKHDARSITKLKPTKLYRQNSQHIETDTTGAALGTINSILAGITRSIQMPQLFEHIKDISSRTSNENRLHGVEEVKINSKGRSTGNVLSKSKCGAKRTSSKVSSSTAIKKMKKSVMKLSEKPTKLDEDALKTSAVPLMDKRSRKIMKRRGKMMPKLTCSHIQNKDLVEIYHNKAVKESKSSESDVPKKRLLQQIETEPQPAQKKELVIDLIPPLNIGVPEGKEVVKTASELSRNYEMPTISSRMKQVAKYYMNSFNIKTIPFCPATSTGPSHNIGINIQQVMSMVKTKQPVQHLSPTLAYNIGLAAGKWTNSPLSILISSMTSRIYSQCPLSRSTINYQQLQEMAKNIPQETIEEGDENEDNLVTETQSIIITGPSGDVKITNPKQTVWTVEGEDKKCNCAPRKGMEFQQIINKFNGSLSKAKISKPMITFKPKVPAKTFSCEVVPTPSDNLPLQNKEKKLKEVLGKLHDEFEQMTKSYDELSKDAEEGKMSEDISKKLESLDKELNSKEEEIIMVMTLYKEVLALKQQVKSLKDRTYSKDNVSIRSHSIRCNNGYQNNSTAAGLLNKLLQQIQRFQTHYKKN